MSGSRPSAAAARSFRIDVKGAEVRAGLRAGGVRPVLLKGGAFATLLYESPGEREYNDVDLLIAPDALDRAFAVLDERGFRRFDVDAPSSQTDPALGVLVGALGAVHGAAWIRDDDQLVVDLHVSLPQATARSSEVWTALSGQVETKAIGGMPTEVLNPAASALLVALHAAHHGPEWGPSLMDLHRALHVLDESTWREARVLANAVGAPRAFGIGLGLDSQGQRLAEMLGLETTPTPALRQLWAGATWTRITLSAFRRERSWRVRALMAMRLAWPSAEAMRLGSQLARRSSLGLLAAYAARPFQLAWLAARPGATGRLPESVDS